MGSLSEGDQCFDALPLQLWVFTGDSIHRLSVFAFFHDCHGSSAPSCVGAWDGLAGWVSSRKGQNTLAWDYTDGTGVQNSTTRYGRSESRKMSTLQRNAWNQLCLLEDPR